MRLIAACLMSVVVGLLVGPRVVAYTTYAKWSTASVTVYLNPANGDVDQTAAETALKAGMNAWNTQANTPFRYVYAGRVNDTSTGYDGRNVILFRNSSNGSALATTYSWYSGSTLVDSDVVFWDGSYRFFSGTSGCSSGAYIEDVATHELGHALGLNHSSDGTATMYPSYSYCSQAMRSLASDDIAGAQALYGKSSSTNTAPAVTISSPSSSTFVQGANISFTGSATDTQDGSLTSQLVWRSSLSGQLAVGGSFTKILTVGTHVITASVTDSGGLTASRQITVSVTSTSSATAPATSPTLSVRGYKVKGSKRADLGWKGFSSTSVDVYRNGTRITSTNNDGSHTDVIGGKGGGSYRYKVCAVSTSTCSNEVTVTF